MTTRDERSQSWTCARAWPDAAPDANPTADPARFVRNEPKEPQAINAVVITYPRPLVTALPRATQAWLVAALLMLLAFAWQGTRALWDPDEGRYTAVALQMLDSGEWLVPRLSDHQEHLTKPPLYYWSVAASVATFGRSEWAVRLPNALAFVLTGLLLLALGREFAPRRAWLAPLAWSTSLFTVLAANVASTDTLLALFETAAMYCAWRAHATGDARRWHVAMWAAFGLAFLTKGPPALLPMLALLAWRALSGRPLRSLFPWQGLLAFAVLGLGWFIWLLAARPELFTYFAGYEFVDRVFTARHGRHPEWYGPFAVYVPALLLATLPWWLLSRGWLRTLRDGLRVAAWRQALAHRPARAFLLLWVVVPLAILCLARSRGVLYALPLAVPLSLLVARDLSGPRALRSMARIAFVAAWAVVVLATKGVAAIALAHEKDARELALALAPALADRPARILFVDETPRFGLRFYSGLPVEEVRSPAHEGPVGDVFVVHSLCSDVADATRPVLALRRDDAAALPACAGGSWTDRAPHAGWRAATWVPDAIAAPAPSTDVPTRG